MIYIFTGSGKGKTTSAIGMAIRAIGAKKKVLIIQFLKPKSFSSESKIIKKIKNLDLKNFGQKGFFQTKEKLKKEPELKKQGIKQFSKKDFDLIEQGFNFVQKAAQSKKYDLLILDEVNYLLDLKLISLQKVSDFLKTFGQKLDIILTGRGCPKQIIDLADLVTEMKEIKHYFKTSKTKARRGIEF